VPDLYRRKVANLHTLLEGEDTRPQAMEIIRSLIERIEIHPGEKRGQCDVILVGALAQILAYAQHKNTAVSDGDDGTFLLVAGVGFEPTTFRL
jgi:site-specific DNA recombinase